MTGLPWDDVYEPKENNEWRGEEHLEDWPENLAGPEYKLYKQELDDEEDEDGDHDASTGGQQ